MDILAAIKREEKKLEKLLGVRSAAKALGGPAEREVVGVRSMFCRLLAEQRL